MKCNNYIYKMKILTNSTVICYTIIKDSKRLKNNLIYPLYFTGKYTTFFVSKNGPLNMSSKSNISTVL